MSEFEQNGKSIFKPIGWEYRVIYLSSFTVLFFAFLCYRGLNFQISTTYELLDIRMTICFLSIFHSYILTFLYRKKMNHSMTLYPIDFMKLSHFVAHGLFAICAAVLLVVIDGNLGKTAVSIYLVLGSYLLGIVCMFLVFSLLVKYQHIKIIREICCNFAVVITTYIVIGIALYENWSLGKLMLNWYPFGNFLLNF